KPNDSEGCDLPPSPPSLPIIGHLHLLLSFLVHKSLQKISSKYGPLLHLCVFNVPIVLVSSASIIYEIFRAQDLNFMKKVMTTKLLGPQALKRSRGVRADELNRFYLNLVDMAMKKESVEIGEEAMKLTNNTICNMLMGRSFSEENDEAEKVRGLVTESDAMFRNFFLSAILHRPLAKLGISLFKKDLADISHRYDEVLEKMLVEYEEKLDEHHEGTEMLDVLLAAFDREPTQVPLLDLLLGGTDTSTHTIQWTMAEIINNPNILKRMREEIDSIVGTTRLIQETDLPNLPYLQAVVKEGLRLHPPGPLVPRTFQKGCKIGGFNVLEKTTLVVNVYANNERSKTGKNPEEFKPERFLVSSRSSQEDEIREEVLKYIPFGSGRKGCPGSNLAHLYIETAIGVMAQCFDWKINGDKVNMEEASGVFSLTMAHPLKCTPLLRTLNPLPSILQNSNCEFGISVKFHGKGNGNVFTHVTLGLCLQ
ncbi:hypothetical protein EUTSA_v10001846mg, partial [Eutrema salsugineum]